MANKNLYTFEVTTTQKCDMACTYCFEGEELKNPDKQVNVTEIISSVYEMLDSSEFMKRYDGVNLNFWGGEPTLNTKLIIQLISEFKDKEVHFFFYTNGLNANNISTIIRHYSETIGDQFQRLAFQISYDGISHDISRIDHNGEGTSARIMKNIKFLKAAFPLVNFSLKATLPIDQLVNLVAHWNHWKDIVDEYPDFSWSPTLEYTNKYLISDEHLAQINNQFLQLAKLEIEYFTNKKRFVFGWFGSQDAVMCSAGANISNIDLQGNISVCHGALYSPNKEDFIIGNIKETGFIESILAMRTRHLDLLVTPESCQGCEATVCYQCPIVQYDNSNKDSYEERYHDPKSDLCGVYKAFGKIDRTVQRHLNIRK